MILNHHNIIEDKKISIELIIDMEMKAITKISNRIIITILCIHVHVCIQFWV